MGMSNLQIPTSLTSLEVLTGLQKGLSQGIDKDSITIGRHSNNDLMIKDDLRCSRQHARISKIDQNFFIENISDKNQVLVNQEPIQKRQLKSGDIVLIGNTEIRFSQQLSSPPLKPVAPPISAAPPAVQPASTPKRPRPSQKPRVKRPPSTGGGNRLRFYTIIAVIGLFVYFLMSEEKKTDEGLQLRTSEQVQMDIEKSIENQTGLSKRLEEKGLDSPQYKSAQTFYLKGFRDYRQGHYKMAMQEFSAALSLFPSHILAKKYYALSKRKLDELIQFHMIQGRRYKKKSNYRMCKAAFVNVIRMINQSDDSIYKEAQSLHNECHKLSQGRY